MLPVGALLGCTLAYKGRLRRIVYARVVSMSLASSRRLQASYKLRRSFPVTAVSTPLLVIYKSVPFWTCQEFNGQILHTQRWGCSLAQLLLRPTRGIAS